MNLILHREPTRALTNWTPFYRPSRLWEDIDELTRELWGSWHPFFERTTVSPHSDIYEENGELVMKTELPGISQDDLEVMLEGDRLTVKAEKKDEVSEDATHHTRERYYGRYQRTTVLPHQVDGDRIKATFENGVLELRLPKAEEIQPQKIEVKKQIPEAKTKKKES